MRASRDGRGSAGTRKEVPLAENAAVDMKKVHPCLLGPVGLSER